MLKAVLETTKCFRGAFFSPFVRAWVPQLESHGIQREDFLTFIDGLNEAWVSHPIFEGLGLVGGVLGMVHGVHPVQIAGAALQFTSGAASAATSFVRTKAYVKAVNADLFHPAGLHATISTTKKMVQEVGYPEERIRLPPLETMEDWDREATAHAHDAVLDGKMDLPSDDPRARRLQALEGYVMPLNFDVPNVTSPDNFMRKIGSANAARRARKQERKMREKREERTKKQAESLKERDKEMAKLQKDLAKEREKLDKELRKEKEEKKRRKALREYEKEEAKILKDMAKEQEKCDRELGKGKRRGEKNRTEVDKKEEKDANGIRWVVISRWNGDGRSDEDSVDDPQEALN